MRNIPTVTKNLLIINILAFMAMYASRSFIDLNDVLGLHFFLAPDFELYQLVSYMFMHANFGHLFFNMFALWMFGMVVENVWGAKKFLFYYICCGVGAGLFQEAAQFGQLYVMASEQIPGFSVSHIFEVAANSSAILNLWTTVGASGAVYAILLAFGLIFPEERIFIFPLPIPIKAKWFVTFYVAVELFSALSTSNDGVAHIAHLGGMVFGFFLIKYWQKHPEDGYRYMQGHRFFDNLKDKWEKRTNRSADTGWGKSDAQNETDWDYNARKKANQEEIDRILDKIRKNGYDSLTAEEKKRLFDSSNR